MRQDYFTFIFDALTRLLSQHAEMFERTGLHMFYGLVAVRLCWFGIRAALSSVSGGSGFHWGRFMDLLQELLIVGAILVGYSTPIPGFGVSFTHLILDQVHHLVSLLNQARIQDLVNTLNAKESALPYPSPWEPLQMFRFVIIVLCITAAQAVTLYVTMWGYVATGVNILVGPLFIPFKVFPQMEWMFWGWLRAFIQYAFYQVIAAAYIFLFGDVLTRMLLLKEGPLSSGELASLFVPLVVTLFVFMLGVLKIPAHTFSIFAGRSGDYVIARWR